MFGSGRWKRVAFLVAALALVPLGISSSGEVGMKGACGASGSCVEDPGSMCESDGQITFNARYHPK